MVKTEMSATHLSRTWLVACAVLVLLLFGKTLSFVGAGQATLEHDSKLYWHLGMQFAHGDWLLMENPQSIRPPGYPAYLGMMQRMFGDYGLVAAVIGQQILDFVVVLLTAWLCFRCTRSPVGAFVGLVGSFFCISRSCFASFLMADNLLCVTLTVYLVMMLLWLERPSWWKTVAIGVLIGTSILIKPSAQLLWLSTIIVMAYKCWILSDSRTFGKYAVIMLLGMFVILSPQYIRNRICYGEYFLVRLTGWSMFTANFSNDEKKLPLPFADGPKTRQFLSEIRPTGIDPLAVDGGAVRNALCRVGHSELESDKLMESVGWEAILNSPWRFAAGRVLRFTWFWITPKAFVTDTPWGKFYSNGVAQPEITPVPGQHGWTLPSLATANAAFLRAAWRPRWYLFALAALAAGVGCVLMISRRMDRDAGLAIGSLLIVMCVPVAVLGWPQYRFRMILEPAMIVAIAVLVVACGRGLQRFGPISSRKTAK
jgi:hypothetical protein